MYTGTLIQDLMATVERAERDGLRRQVLEVVELERIYELQSLSMMPSIISSSSVGGEQVYVGAA
jgi:hypothetical protein